MRSRILSTCFICLFFAACGEQEKTSVINKTTEVKTPETPTKKEAKKSIQQKARPALNLSIENVPLDNQESDKDIFNEDKEPTDTQSELFDTLNRKQTESDINLSGKVLTDEEKIDNEEYLDSIDGLQINIEGSFE